MASRITRSGIPIAQSVYEESSTQKAPLGELLEFADGRRFRYAKNGAVALAAGKLCQGPVPAAEHLGCTVYAAAAVGDKILKATLGALLAAKNLYAGGYVHVNDADGEGLMYQVKSHLAVLSAGVITLNLEDALWEALLVTSKVTLTANKYSGVVITPTTLTAPVVGIPVIDITIAYYHWLQTRGPAVCLIDDTVVIGNAVRPSANTGGAVQAHATDSILRDVGVVMRVNATTEYGLIDLKIE